MKVTINLDIPEESVYAGVVADALTAIAGYWDDGAREGDLVVGPGPEPLYVSWDSDTKDEAECCAGCGEYFVPGGDSYMELCASCADKGEMQGDRYVPFDRQEYNRQYIVPAENGDATSPFFNDRYAAWKQAGKPQHQFRPLAPGSVSCWTCGHNEEDGNVHENVPVPFNQSDDDHHLARKLAAQLNETDTSADRFDGVTENPGNSDVRGDSWVTGRDAQGRDSEIGDLGNSGVRGDQGDSGVRGDQGNSGVRGD